VRREENRKEDKGGGCKGIGVEIFRRRKSSKSEGKSAGGKRIKKKREFSKR